MALASNISIRLGPDDFKFRNSNLEIKKSLYQRLDLLELRMLRPLQQFK